MNQHKRGFTSRRHPEPALLPLRAALKGCYSGSNKTISGSSRIFNKGFTLLEVLVVVLIIAVLAAIAVPQYKHAVLKSRFSAVMPMAKSVADAQEVYYLSNGQYATHKSALDVTPVSAENTTVELSGAEENADENYAYVVASRSDVPGAKYIQYQKNSPQFASNIHCEALTGDEEPNWLCKALGGEYIGENGDYTAYLLSGDSTTGTFLKECKGTPETEATCPSGCGTGTRTAECDTKTGEWSYGEWSGCSTKPATSQECSANSKTGTQTRSVTCSDGTWVTGNWSSCAIPCAGNKPANITASKSGATGTATCVEGEWVYTSWTNGRTFNGFYDQCKASVVDYGCAGATYIDNNCGTTNKGKYMCMGSSFGDYAHCYGYKAGDCQNTTYTGYAASCYGKAANACTGATFKGNETYCSAEIAGGCNGTTIEAGSYCYSSVSGGCDGAKYGEDPTGVRSGIGVCSGSCPTGVPQLTSWNLNPTTQSYNYTWNGNCCNPKYMVSGQCPEGIAICQ